MVDYQHKTRGGREATSIDLKFEVDNGVSLRPRWFLKYVIILQGFDRCEKFAHTRSFLARTKGQDIDTVNILS